MFGISFEKNFKMLFICVLLILECIQSASCVDAALGKQTNQSSTSGSYVSKLGVDSSVDTCSQTSAGQDPWWYVDLGDYYSVEKVLIYFSRDNDESKIGIEIRVTDDFSTILTSNNICGSKIAAGRYYQIIDCKPYINGNYVSFYRNTTSSLPLILCDVRVFAELFREIPVISDCPDDFAVFTSTGLSVVNWRPPTVTDDRDTDLWAVCIPPSGAYFSVGNTTVTCTVTDSQHNEDSCSFNVQVIPDCPGCIVCSNDINVSTTSNQATVSWNGPYIVDYDHAGKAACTPSSGSFFPAGSTDVTCSSTNAAGGIDSTCTFKVNVYDTTSPIVVCPNDFHLNTISSKVLVTWNEPYVIDNVDTFLSCNCSPHSGSFFAVGSTDVACVSTDAAGNNGICTFRVYVIEDGVDSFSQNVYQITIITLCIIIIVMLILFYLRACYSHQKEKQNKTESNTSSSEHRQLMKTTMLVG